MTRVLPGILLLGLCASSVSCHRGPRPAIPGAAALPPVVSDQADQVNMPPWEGGWSVIGRGSPVVRFSQTFTPMASRLSAIEIDIMTGNRGRGGDDITVTIVDGNRVLARASRFVAEGFDGVLRFDFTSPDVMVTPGIALHLRVEDTNKDVFGWRYGRDTYPGGSAYFNGAPWNNGAFDFRFRTYGS